MAQEQLWEDLARQRLEDVLEPEMVKQYRLRRGEQCMYMPLFGQERYLCSCGTVNPLGRKCYICGLEPEPLTRTVVEELRQAAQERLEQEEAERQRLEAQRQERREAAKRAKRKKRIRNLVILSACVLVALVLATVLFWSATRVWIPKGHMEDGLAALENGQYPEAYRHFTLAGSYGDAKLYASRFSTPLLTERRESEDQQVFIAYSYDEKGRLLVTDQTVKDIADDGSIEAERSNVWSNIYDDVGHTLQRQDANGTEICTYNERGHVLTRDGYRSDGTHDTTRTFVYVYDEQGRLEQSSEICSELISVNYSYEQIIRYTYDAAGREATRTNQINYPASPEVNCVSEAVNTYDEQGRLIRCEETSVTPNDPTGDSSRVEEWRYDDWGREVFFCRTTVFPGEPMLDSVQTVTTTYNDRGEILTQITEDVFPGDRSRDMVRSVTYVYDREGRVAKQTKVQEFVDEHRQLQSGYTCVITNSYDLLGRLTELRTVWDYSDAAAGYVQTETYSYRADGTVNGYVQTTKWREAGRIPETQSVQCNEAGLPWKVTLVTEDGEEVSEYSYAYYYNE